MHLFNLSNLREKMCESLINLPQKQIKIKSTKGASSFIVAFDQFLTGSTGIQGPVCCRVSHALYKCIIKGNPPQIFTVLPPDKLFTVISVHMIVNLSLFTNKDVFACNTYPSLSHNDNEQFSNWIHLYYLWIKYLKAEGKNTQVSMNPFVFILLNFCVGQKLHK